MLINVWKIRDKEIWYWSYGYILVIIIVIDLCSCTNGVLGYWFWFQKLCDIYWKSLIECIGIVNLWLLLFIYTAFVIYCHDADLPYGPHIWIGYRWKNDRGLIILKLSIVRKDMLKSYLLFERICLCFYKLFTFGNCRLYCYGTIVRIIIACLPLYCYSTYHLSYGLHIGKLLKLFIGHTKIVYLSHGSTSCCIELNTRNCYYFIIWKDY